MHGAGGYAIASWHQNCFAGILSHSGKPLNLLVSRSFDGELIAYVARKLGLGSARGSSSRGGKEALSELFRIVEGGEGAAITVDGPRGPAHQVKNGILALSSKTGVAILPLASIANRYWTLRSWDRFRLPKPFAKVLVYYGDPYVLPKELSEDSFEMHRNRLEDELTQLDVEAHRYLGMETQGALQRQS